MLKMTISHSVLTDTCPLLLVGCLMVLGGVYAQPPNAFTHEATGLAVVKQSVGIVANIFGDDANMQLFLCRIAAAESLLGLDSRTFRDRYHGGIWQVDKAVFDVINEHIRENQHQTIRDEITTALGKDWITVIWEDLRTPIYSAVAARLHLYFLGVNTIPQGIRRQARLWRDTYHKYMFRTEGLSSVHDFRRRVLALKGDPHIFQVVPGSEKPICYDVEGNDGDEFKFLDDPLIGIQIVARLFKKKGNKKVFVDNLDIVSGPNAIRITPRLVYLDGDAFPWLPRKVVVGSGMDTIDMTADNRTIVIETVLAEIVVWRIFGHLDFDASPIGGFGRNATGILADVANNVQIVVRSPGNNDIANYGAGNGKPKNTRHLLVSNPDGGQSSRKLRSNKRCWRFDRDETFERLITRNLL